MNVVMCLLYLLKTNVCSPAKNACCFVQKFHTISYLVYAYVSEYSFFNSTLYTALVFLNEKNWSASYIITFCRRSRPDVTAAFQNYPVLSQTSGICCTVFQQLFNKYIPSRRSNRSFCHRCFLGVSSAYNENPGVPVVNKPPSVRYFMFVW